MRVALGQINMIWEEKEVNKARCESMIMDAYKNQADMIIFPEMTLTGFSMNLEVVAEHPDESSTLLFFKKMSRKYGMAIAFGYSQKIGNRALNKLAVVLGGRMIMDYTKIHPFSIGREAESYDGGNQLAWVKLEGVNLGAFICYDLRFPEIFTASARHSHAMMVIANWPKERTEQWDILLRARAIENQCYMIGVNRCGEGGGVSYLGHSCVIDPYGNQIAGGFTDECIVIADIDPYLVEEYREEFPVKRDRRPDVYRLM